MTDPFRMVFVNLIASFILIVGLLFYRYVFPKKKINLLVLLILISILPIISIFRPGDYESGDFNIHIYRIMSFYDSLFEGHIMPSWAAEVNATYGNPLFIFNYPLPYYLVSLFHFVGFSFIGSMKIFLGSTFFFSGIFMYFAMKKIVKNELAAFSAAVFYLFNPYHLTDVHFRATPGESMVFTLAPLLIYFATCFLQEKKLKYLILITLVTILLSLAHPLVSLTIFGLVIIFTVTLRGVQKRIKSLIYLFIALAVGLLASLYVWVPFLVYSKIIYPDPNTILVFNPFYELFFSPYKYGLLYQGNHGELLPFIGYSQIIGVLVGIFLLIKTNYLKKIKLQFLVWFIILFILIFLMNPMSYIVWQHFKTLWILEGRLPLPMAVCTSTIAGYVAVYFSKKKNLKIILYIFLFLTIFSTILNWGQRRVIPSIEDTQLKAAVWRSSAEVEGFIWFLNTRWSEKNRDFDSLPKAHLVILKGKGQIKELSRNSTEHTYVINALTPLTIKENTMWYPGWSLKSDYKSITIYPGKAGIINAKLQSGLQYVTLSYEDIPIIKVLKLMGITITIILILVLAGSLSGHPKYFSRNL